MNASHVSLDLTRLLDSRPCLLAAILLVALPAPAGAQQEDEVAPIADSFWAPPTEVVQARKVEKTGAFELSALVGVVPNDEFLIYVPLGMRVAYHFSEQWAAELGFEYNLSADTGLRAYLERNNAELRARIRDRQQLRAAASAQWSPIYGKLAVGKAVVHFDGYLNAGAGVLRLADTPEQSLAASMQPDFHLGLGARFFFGRRFLLRLEFRQYLYVRPEPAGQGSSVGAASEIGICLGALLGGRR